MEPRNFSSGTSVSPPTPLASPSVGYPTAGNPGTGTPATKPGAYWYHQVGEELRNLILAAGLTPSDAALTQVAQAVQILITASVVQDYKASVRVATTANITALNGSAPNTLDGVTLAANDRILVKDQGTGSQNGIYYVAILGTGANGTWTRATDADGVGELTAGSVVLVEEGTANADSKWMLTTDGTITIGTTALTFARKDAGAAVGLPTGALMYFPATTPPSGWLKRNGALLSRTTYAALWAYAQGSGNLAANDGAWQVGQFSPGDGSTTFRIPDGRGEFERGWDDGRGVDAGRVLGSAQADDFKSHSHSSVSASGLGQGAGGGVQYVVQGGTTGAAGGVETRPRNIALLACIKF